MKKQGNNLMLMNYHEQLENFRESNSVLYQLFYSRISEFYKHNAIRIDSVTKEMVAIQVKYFEVDETGNAKYEEPLKDSKIITMFKPEKKAGKQPQPIMLPGMKMEEYEIEFKEIMSRQVEIIF